jgi:hypothetical protein
MTKFYAHENGRYAGAFGPGTVVPEGLIEVSSPPPHANFFSWTGSDWVEDSNRADVELENNLEASVNVGKINKLNFKLHLDSENRLRALEGKPSVTAGQYRNALKAILGSL